MTRFARAKGSKASNERICEEATSWEEMKQQLIEKKKEIEDEGERTKMEKVRNTNYQNFLKDKNEHEVNKSEWAEFPNITLGVKNKKSIKHSHKYTELEIKESLENAVDSGIKAIKTSRKQHNRDINNDEHSDSDVPVEISSKIEISMPQIKKSKQKKKKLSIVVENNADIERVQKVEDIQNEENEKCENKIKSGNPNNKKRKLIDMESLTEPEKKKIEKKQERRIKQIEKKKLKKQMKAVESKKGGENGDNILLYQNENTAHNLSDNSKGHNKSPDKISVKNKDNFKNNKTGSNMPKKEKLKTGEFKRRKSFQPDKIMINGKEVAISYFEGFPIKKEDAIKLKKLRKEMVSKGLPRSEINRTIQLERRKAEKALAREKKNVCFNCRKFGHNLAECTEMSKGSNQELFDSTGTGICFKCGSSEHTSFACKVVQGANFKFATCFICKEQGHISRQCPDNARGLYPKGGCCNVCGDVTHLKRDCPQFRSIQENEQEKFQVETISSGNPDDMDKEVNYGGKNTVRPNKIIKF